MPNISQLRTLISIAQPPSDSIPDILEEYKNTGRTSFVVPNLKDMPRILKEASKLHSFRIIASPLNAGKYLVTVVSLHQFS